MVDNVKQKIGGKCVERRSWALPKATVYVRNIEYNTAPLHLFWNAIMWFDINRKITTRKN